MVLPGGRPFICRATVCALLQAFNGTESLRLRYAADAALRRHPAPLPPLLAAHDPLHRRLQRLGAFKASATMYTYLWSADHVTAVLTKLGAGDLLSGVLDGLSQQGTAVADGAAAPLQNGGGGSAAAGVIIPGGRAVWSRKTAEQQIEAIGGEVAPLGDGGSAPAGGEPMVADSNGETELAGGGPAEADSSDESDPGSALGFEGAEVIAVKVRLCTVCCWMQCCQ